MAEQERKIRCPYGCDSTEQVIYVVKAEYESGSQNGEVVELLSAHRTQEGAEAAVAAWRESHDYGETHGMDPDEDEDEHWCPKCGWGADWETVELGD